MSPLATPRQIKFIQAIGREYGIGADELDGRARDRYGRSVAELSRYEASSFIEALQSLRNADR